MKNILYDLMIFLFFLILGAIIGAIFGCIGYFLLTYISPTTKANNWLAITGFTIGGVLLGIIMYKEMLWKKAKKDRSMLSIRETAPTGKG